MKISFLGQGFEHESKNAIGNLIIKLFSEDKFYSFTGIAAFASELGAVALKDCISKNREQFSSLNLIVGVDQEGTSKNALEEINSLDINSYIFYQKESPIFHPKIYLFEGEENITLIVGSSNLTGKGLFGNIESSLLVEFEIDNPEGIALLAELKSYYSTLFDFSDPNLFKITPEMIKDFVDDGIVPTKSVWVKKHSKKTSDSEPTDEPNLNIPKRRTAKIPSIYKQRKRNEETISKLIPELEIENSFQFDEGDEAQEIWESGSLTERDLNIPSGEKTNATGSMLFKKGRMEGIDQRHYFRDDVFSDLNWEFDTRTGHTHIEIAKVKIRFVIKGMNFGVYEIELSHNTNTELKTYKQRQPMTNLRWGDSKPLIAQEDLLGKIAKLHRVNSSTEDFILTID